jgi:shikimate kinase
MRLDFIDLDWYIEGRYHRTVRQLFSELGETGFREIERAMLHEVGEFEDVVIATGGGAPCFYDNLDYMNAQGQTVFLDVDLDTLHRRLRAPSSNVRC